MLEILLVDDSCFFRERLQLMLGDEPGMVVTGEAKTGHEALALVAQRRFDLVLLDLSLPDLTGFQVLTQIKHRHPALSIIMVSGQTEALLAAKALSLGAAAYVTKDRCASDLVATIWVTAGSCVDFPACGCLAHAAD